MLQLLWCNEINNKRSRDSSATTAKTRIVLKVKVTETLTPRPFNGFLLLLLLFCLH